MSLGRDEVLHVARLAQLAVPEDEVDRLVAQFNRILEYVAQLAEVGGGESEPGFLPGPDRVRLRADLEGPVPLAGPPAALAPEFRDGFFLVPRQDGTEAP